MLCVRTPWVSRDNCARYCEREALLTLDADTVRGKDILELPTKSGYWISRRQMCAELREGSTADTGCWASGAGQRACPAHTWLPVKTPVAVERHHRPPHPACLMREFHSPSPSLTTEIYLMLHKEPKVGRLRACVGNQGHLVCFSITCVETASHCPNWNRYSVTPNLFWNDMLVTAAVSRLCVSVYPARLTGCTGSELDLFKSCT